MPIIREQVKPDSIVYTDFYRSYDVLDVSEFSHFRINHSTHFAEKQNYINGIENFGRQAKRHLRKFNGIPKEHFELYLKECEWRFNHSDLKTQISILKQLVREYLFWLSRTAPNRAAVLACIPNKSAAVLAVTSATKNSSNFLWIDSFNLQWVIFIFVV